MAWILTIARNICMMKFRQRKHDSIIPFDEIKETPDCSQIEDLEDRLILETAFRILSREECQIVMLHAVSGLKHRAQQAFEYAIVNSSVKIQPEYQKIA